ncbi:MAG TPA: cobalt-precorrin-6A reductase, partial [Rhizobiaceae bacterium]|nr:cobalt-precorrin-6A reductase [Rhizobiaceae bacterium]
AELAAANPGARIVTSLAGRTREPAPLAGETRIGGFGGAAGLAMYLRENAVTRLIDATHPVATQISANAVEAARITGVPLETRTRKAWTRQSGDIWIEVATLQEACAAIPFPTPKRPVRVLLALGSQHIGVFASRDDVHFVVRMVDAPGHPLPFTRCTLITGKSGATVEAEVALLREHAITHVVCRNSGGAGAYAKIKAARHLGLPVIMIGRPQ